MPKIKLLFVLALGLIIFVSQTALSASAQVPEFKLGFKALADQIPSVAGQPLENEQWGANGDSLQRTTTGLMVWRKADNWTAFTDGSRTWVNGPSAAMERSNEERFEWEAGGEPAARPPTSLAPAAGGFWTVIVRSAGTRAEAEQVAEQLRSSGLPGAVLFSSDYASLNPGYWVAYSGQLADRDSASRESVRLQQLGFAGAYPREVRRALTASPEPPPPTGAPTYPRVGQRLTWDGIALTVNSVSRLSQVGTDYVKKPAPGKTILVVDVTVENVARPEPYDYSRIDYAVKGADGYVIELSSLTYSIEGSLSSGELARGERVRGKVAFEVPLGATGFVLIYEGWAPVRNVTVALD